MPWTKEDQSSMQKNENHGTLFVGMGSIQTSLENSWAFGDAQ
jgi:hypothetical protein